MPNESMDDADDFEGELIAFSYSSAQKGVWEPLRWYSHGFVETSYSVITHIGVGLFPAT
jgi:hypothetical protein